MPRPRTDRPPTFYNRVYQFVAKIPAGSVVTYGQVALELGSPAAARAVGYALFFMPAEVDVPWWRVVNASGGISHKGRGAAADLQRQRLEEEGLRFNDTGHLNLGRCRWWPDEGRQDGDDGEPAGSERA
jgi:methylated-DNA-protein-cysteine methyltransferase-like protein